MGVSVMTRICLMISFMVIFWNSFTPGTEGKCNLQSIHYAGDPNDPITTADTCIGKEYKRGGGTKPLINAVEWKKGSDYSHGNLDDFCLHTQISDSKDFYESQARIYRGIGSKKFLVLDKLVKKSAWSFQMNGPLKTVNMNWTVLEENYQLLINQSKANLLELEEFGLEAELNLRYKIREALEHDYTEDLIKDDNPHWDKDRENLDGLPQLFDRNEADWTQQPIIKKLKEKNKVVDELFEKTRVTKEGVESGGKKIIEDKKLCPTNYEIFHRKHTLIYQVITQFVLEYERCKEDPVSKTFPPDCPYKDYNKENQIVKPSWNEWSNRAGIWSDIYTNYIPPGPNELFKNQPPLPRPLWDSLLEQAKEKNGKPYELTPTHLEGNLKSLNACLCRQDGNGKDLMQKLLGGDAYNCKAVLGYARDIYLQIRYKEVIEWLLEIPKFEKAVNFCKAQGVLWTNRFHTFKKLMDTRKNSQYAPDFEAKNPYFLEVTGITMRGQPLKNFLHVRIFMNQSVSDDKYRLHTNPKYSPGNAERRNRAQGKIKAVLLIVKDQDGFPVGSFDKPIPCQRTCRDRNHNTPVHDHSNYKNDLPCSFTPPTAVEHPGLFIWPPGEESTWPEIGVREVHATWHFAQDTCNFVTELHFQALVFENLRDEFLGPDRLVPNPLKMPPPENCLLHKLFDRKFLPGNTKEFRVKYNVTEPFVTEAEVKAHFEDFTRKVGENYDKIKKYSGRGHLWGWTTQYSIIVPTIKSVGGHDWVNIPKLREYNRRYNDINCHAPLNEKFGFVKSVPVERGEDFPNQGMYTLKLMTEFPQNLNQPDLQYYGVHYGPRDKGYYRCRKPEFNIKFNHGPNLTKALDQLKKLPSARQYVEAPNRNNIRCPCPLKPTTARPEDRTVGPEQIQGRIFHASHMSLAWMVCIPLAVFVARYFKETYSTVFCVQEYWWFAWHVFWMIAATVFMIGGNLSVVAKRSELIIPDSREMRTHKLLGWASINIFAFQLTSGLFRHKDPSKRIYQMILHYVLGVLNFSISSIQIGIISMVPGSSMTCEALITYGCWLLFLIIMYTIMEIHMQITDDILDLDPPRTKCPIRFKRLFGTDAPGRKLRMVMLIIYLLGISLFWCVMCQYIWNSEGLSCKDYLDGKTPTIGKVRGDQVQDATYPNSTVEEQF